DMAEKPRYRALASIDPRELAKFQAGIRKRYTDEQIVAEIVACAERLGRSPTMREFAADGETAVHPQTVIEHFGSWNAAKRAAGPEGCGSWRPGRKRGARTRRSSRSGRSIACSPPAAAPGRRSSSWCASDSRSRAERSRATERWARC